MRLDLLWSFRRGRKNVTQIGGFSLQDRRERRSVDSLAWQSTIMNFSCPVCASLSVEPAGRTATYQSLVCADCHSWSTVPLEPERAKPRPTAPEPRVQP